MNTFDACEAGQSPARASETGCLVRRETRYPWSCVCERVGSQFRVDGRMQICLHLAADWPVCSDGPGETVHYSRTGAGSLPFNKSNQLARASSVGIPETSTVRSATARS